MTAPRDADRLLDAVVHRIEAVGYDAVELRVVAREARVSLATIYRRFPSRLELLQAAVELWMDEHVYGRLTPPAPDAGVAQRLVTLHRQVFEPWLRHPRMLDAFVRARQNGGDHRLGTQGAAVVGPLMLACFGDDPDMTQVGEISRVVSHVVYSVMAQYAAGTMTADQMLRDVELTIRLLVADVHGRSGTSPRTSGRALGRRT